jgi:hypothetical protein
MVGFLPFAKENPRTGWHLPSPAFAAISNVLTEMPMTKPDTLPTTLPDLTPDCQSCDALCCVVLAFDACDAFGFDKPACTPCQNLTAGNQCRIHADLADQGFAGCARFNCHGAGQKVTQDLFKGRSWRRDPSLLPAIDHAFRLQRRLHEALVLLIQSGELPLSPDQASTRQSLMESLSAPRSLHDPEPQAALSQTAWFFAGLRSVTPPRR